MLFSKQKNIVGVAFDIGTASVSAALFEIPAGAIKPNIVKIFRQYHKASLQSEALQFSKSTLNQFSAILKDIRKYMKDKKPTLFVIGLSSIFYLSKTKKLYEKRTTSRAITQSELDGFIKKGEQEFLLDLKREDVVVFETVLMRSLLNGYAAYSQVGKNAEEVELWLHYAATSRELYRELANIVHGFYSGATIRYSTFPVVLWSLTKELLFPEHSVLLVDIGGELTEVTFLVDGVITEVLSLPFGVLNILVRISEAEHVEIENALSLLKGYTAGTLTNEVSSRIHIIIKKETANWEEYFERVWQRASRDIMNNIKMYFLGGGALIEEMKTAVAPPLLHPNLARGLEVHLIAPEAFRDKFANYCCFEGAGDFGLLGLVVNVRPE